MERCYVLGRSVESLIEGVQHRLIVCRSFFLDLYIVFYFIREDIQILEKRVQQAERKKQELVAKASALQSQLRYY